MATWVEGVESRNPRALLEMCDSVRSSLVTTSSLGQHGEPLMKFLKSVLADEVHGTAEVLSFDTILGAHLDRMLETLLDPLNKPSELVNSHRAVLAAASTLQKQWRARFKQRYSGIQDVRDHTILATGRLRAVSFVAAAVGNGTSRWESTLGEEPPELDSSTQFEPG